MELIGVDESGCEADLSVRGAANCDGREECVCAAAASSAAFQLSSKPE